MWSEVTLYHPDDARWFLNCDETHHTLSTASNKGGSRSFRRINPSFPRSGERTVESARHFTGLYTVNLAGEALPPLYIFDSKCQNDENFSVDLRACDGLPEVTGKYGYNKLTSIGSYVAVRKKGGTDAPLWNEFNETVLQPLYPRMSKTVKRCPITQKMLEGPLVTKTDAGPGRLAKSVQSLQFRERAYQRGQLIFLGLPNSSAATQEMDQGFSKYQNECKVSTVRVAGIKIKNRLQARKKTKGRIDGVPLDGEEGSPDDVNEEESAQAVHKTSVCNVSFTPQDLPRIVNGYPGDPIDLRPFDKTFTKEIIKSWWAKVGFLPMNRNSLHDPKVRWEKGGGGAPKEAEVRIARLESAYQKYVHAVSAIRMNGAFGLGDT